MKLLVQSASKAGNLSYQRRSQDFIFGVAVSILQIVHAKQLCYRQVAILRFRLPRRASHRIDVAWNSKN